MMIVPFIPKHDLDTESNLKLYIQHIKDNAIFFRGEGAVNWDDDRWDLTSFYPTTGNVKTAINFTDNRGKKGKPFIQPFMDETKAIVADFLRQNNSRQISSIITPIRRIYNTLPISEKGQSFNDLSDIELYSIEEFFSSSCPDPYPLCRVLERLVYTILEPAKLTKSRLSWKSRQKFKSPNRSNLVGERNKLTNATIKKLPDIRCIMDLASIFNNSLFPPDVIISSWFALSMYAPSRINEILTLPVNCERYDTSLDCSSHGIAWLPEKGGDAIVKRAVGEEWAKVGRTAIQRLTNLGRNARKAAKWYEKQPTSLFLPSGYEHLRGKPLTLYEMGMIIGRGEGIPTRSSLAFGLKPTKLITTDFSRSNSNNWVKLYTFESLEAYVLKKLPVGWPHADQRTKLRYSNALFTMPYQIMSEKNVTCVNGGVKTYQTAV